MSTSRAAKYGVMPDGRPVQSFTLESRNGLKAVLLEYGAILQSVEAPDRSGRLADVTLGFDSLPGWLGSVRYFGATVGRHANRIAKGRFTLDGVEYVLATNNSPGGMACHLHGGNVGFDKRLWSGKTVDRGGAAGVEFTLSSRDGEEGYPGGLQVKATYCITDGNELAATFEATTDRPTIVNIAQHAYWNLTGDPRRSIADHVLKIAADAFVPVGAGLIPLGTLAPVSGTPFDFTQPTAVGSRIDAVHEQLKFANGYDHCWVLRQGGEVRLAALLRDPESGRVLELLTDQPGVQFYSGNFLDGSTRGKGGTIYGRRSGLCLETENFPDAPNQPGFPSPVLRPGETYRHRMVFRFSAQ